MLIKKVRVIVDRPMGTYHPNHKDLYYPVNYGYIDGIFAADGEEQDAYILGVDKPVKSFTGFVAAIIHRRNDIEDKWVVLPENLILSRDEIYSLVSFQEQYFDVNIIMLTKPIIRRATADDCYEIARVKQNVWQTAYKNIYPADKVNSYDLKHQQQKFIREVDNPDIHLYVCEVDGYIVGYMSCGKNYREKLGYNFEIKLLNLHVSFRGFGIGRVLFCKACDVLKNMGAKEFIIACNKYNNPAQAFYKKMGGMMFAADEDCDDKSIPQVYFRYTLNEILE